MYKRKLTTKQHLLATGGFFKSILAALKLGNTPNIAMVGSCLPSPSCHNFK